VPDLANRLVDPVVQSAGFSEGFCPSCLVLACHLRGAASEPPSLSRKALLTEGGSEVQVAGQDRARAGAGRGYDERGRGPGGTEEGGSGKKGDQSGEWRAWQFCDEETQTRYG
jgi:hypothetical protein